MIDHNDEMWKNMGPILIAVNMVLTTLGTLVVAYLSKRNGDKLDVNTKMTEVTVQNAADAKVEAAKAVDANREVAVALNGRMTESMENHGNARYTEGLMEGTKMHEGLATRITALEAGHDVLCKGQDDIRGGLDEIMKEIKKQSKF